MNLSEGAPWWLTITLAVASAAATHWLTTCRERKRENGEWLHRWHTDAKELVGKISNAASAHYLDQDSVVRTGISAALIINDLKRLQACLREAECKNGSDAKRTADAYRCFLDIITGQDDFQDEQRDRRPSTSEISRMIRDAEEVLLEALRAPRRRSTQE